MELVFLRQYYFKYNNIIVNFNISIQWVLNQMLNYKLNGKV
jgi:hypothetical protein